MVNIKKYFEQGSFHLKKFFGKTSVDIKEPKKKVEIRLDQYEDFLDKQMEMLEETLSHREISEITRTVGEDLQNQALMFKQMNFIDNSRSRINGLLTSLLEGTDYAVWVNKQSKYLSEQIHCFVSTIREPLE